VPIDRHEPVIPSTPIAIFLDRVYRMSMIAEPACRNAPRHNLIL